MKNAYRCQEVISRSHQGDEHPTLTYQGRDLEVPSPSGNTRRHDLTERPPRVVTSAQRSHALASQPARHDELSDEFATLLREAFILGQTLYLQYNVYIRDYRRAAELSRFRAESSCATGSRLGSRLERLEPSHRLALRKTAHSIKPTSKK